MTTIQVDTSSPYHVLIGHGILHTLGDQICALGGAEKVCLVSDTHVWQRYGQTVVNALTAASLSVHPFVFPAGEQSKNGSVFLNILDHMARSHMTRRDVVVALGGGVVGDMAGFCAACYMRGIRFVQVPTTGSAPPAICAASVSFKFPPLSLRQWIPALAGKPPSICPPAKIWQVPSTSPVLCCVT